MYECSLCESSFVTEHLKNVHINQYHSFSRNQKENEKINRWLEEHKKSEKRCRACQQLFIGPVGSESCLDCNREQFKHKFGEEYAKKRW